MITEPNESIVPTELSTLYNGDGLTKREYFAALALQGIIAAYVNKNIPSPDFAANKAVEYADYLIKELNKEQT